MQISQTFLVLGALVLFTLSALFLNESMLDNDIRLMETEFRLSAFGIGQSYLEAVQSLAFDEVVVDTSFSGPLPESFTTPAALGPDGEGVSGYDDVDDFNGYTVHQVTPRSEFDVAVSVSYADSLTMAAVDSAQTCLKVVTVVVTSPFYADSIRMHYMMGYY